MNTIRRPLIQRTLFPRKPLFRPPPSFIRPPYPVFRRPYAHYRRFKEEDYRNDYGLGYLLQSKFSRQVILFTGVGITIFYFTHLDKCSILVCFFLYVLTSNSHTVPISGRRRFILFGPKVSEYMGKLTYKQLMMTYGNQMLPDSNGYVRQAKRVTKRIVDQTNLGNLDWQVHIINSNEPPNAFVLPGGKVFIFSSILPIMKNEDGMATVLSHEIAHQLARHQDEKLSSAPFYLALSLIGALVFQTTQFSDLLLNLFLELPASRQMESEADYIGLMTMAKACYNPAEAINVWTRMQRAAGRLAPQQFLSTHPSSANRIEKMREWQGKALQEARDAGCDSVSGYTPGFWNYNQL